MQNIGLGLICASVSSWNKPARSVRKCKLKKGADYGPIARRRRQCACSAIAELSASIPVAQIGQPQTGQDRDPARFYSQAGEYDLWASLRGGCFFFQNKCSVCAQLLSADK